MSSAAPPRSDRARALDGPELRDLLTIDVASELRKLSQAQLQGPWQLPAELVRRAIRAGAGRIAVTFARRQIVVTDDGAGLPPAHLVWTAALLDGQHDEAERHHALTALEAAGDLAMLALAGLADLRALTIETCDGHNHHRLAIARGQGPILQSTPDPRAPVPPGTRITLRANLDQTRASRWLADVARFAPVRLTIDGTRLRPAWSGALVKNLLLPPLRGGLALMPERDAGHVHLLAFGLVVAHVTVPGSPGFEAALEMGGADGGTSPARLREESLALVPELTDQALSLLIAAAPALATGPRRQREQIARLTLQAARRRQRLPEIERLPVFGTISEGGAIGLVDLVTLWQIAGSDPSGGHALCALSPADRPQDHALGPLPVLIADDAERSLLAEVLHVHFRAPSRTTSGHSLGALLRRLRHHTLRAARGLADRLRLSARKPPLPDDSLSPGQQALLIALRADLRARPGRLRDVFFCAGDGPVRRTGGNKPALVLPRDNPTVAACVRAFAADPNWIKLIHPALTAGQNGER
jgi:hypothetical protein